MILALALFLRVFSLTHHDVYTDEALLAFRAIGLIDYDAAFIQTTPWQWFPTVPWWARLSFHDDPILFFLLEHWSMSLLGVNLIAVRLPAVLAGVGSVAIIYLIGKRLAGEKAGLIAASLLAVSSYHVWVSRVGLQDGVVIVVTMLTLWLVMKAREDDPRWWLAAGASLGLGIITKYSILIIVPVILWYALVYRWKFYRARAFWLGCLAVFLIMTPSWLYNLKLYQARGHFDFQISAFLSQAVPEWSVRFGRSLTGGPKDRAINFFRALHQGGSPVFNGLALVGVLGGIAALWKRRDKAALFLLGTIILFFLWFLVIGSTYRFVVMVVPVLALLIARFISHFPFPISHYLSLITLVIFLLFELFYSTNSFLLKQPIGRVNITYAQVNEETQNFGFNQLEDYLRNLLAGKMPKFAGTPEYQFIVAEQTDARARFKRAGREPYPVLIIYEKDLNFLASLWIFTRRLIYEGWPIISDAEFARLTGGQYDQFYRAQGIEKFVYIAAANPRVIRPVFDRVGKSEELLQYLNEKRLEPTVIRNRAGVEAFWVYHF